MADLIKTKENLEKKHYTVSVFETKEDACAYLTESIKGVTVGFGGSVTLKEMDLIDKLKEENTIYNHWTPLPGKTPDEMRALAMGTDVYLSSVNGMSENGEIINIDGTGNRVASTIFGHKKVYLVVGANKIAPDFDGAMWRARNISAPLNAQRLNRKTPCAVNGDKCYDCDSEERICRALTVFWTKPTGSDYEIILINEDLGL